MLIRVFFLALGLCSITWQHFLHRVMYLSWFLLQSHSFGSSAALHVLRLSDAFSAMTGSSLLGATLSLVLASEYSQEYFIPGPDGNYGPAKHLTTIECDGRDGYSTVLRRHSLLLVTSGLHVMKIRLVRIFCRIPAKSCTPQLFLGFGLAWAQFVCGLAFARFVCIFLKVICIPSQSHVF